SRLALRKGDRLLVEAQGEWSCGRLGEMTGPEGYPQTRKYSHYYGQGTKELRQTMRANYGTLLMRVGKDGPLIPVSKRKAIKVDGDGELYFDINEIDDQKQRRDNQGALVVKIKKAPPPE
ncbi:MAG: hypothetical protein K9N51_12350, partial [Candidatus Pacebacteria bacterium]|nr:hypothetical protein [Candidatus Paceibacterota bacterium]